MAEADDLYCQAGGGTTSCSGGGRQLLFSTL